jgi:uncharacterized protein YndB with AHSA1/START domain
MAGRDALGTRQHQEDNVSAGKDRTARAIADPAERRILASVEIGVSAERVFRALASKEILGWWVRPGVFNTTKWVGDVRVGGRWRASGIGRGRPYVLEGEFLEIDPPRKLVHTWHPAGAPGEATTVTYLVESFHGGRRLTLRHSGFASREVCGNTAIGWETSFERLAECLAAEVPARGRVRRRNDGS